MMKIKAGLFLLGISFLGCILAYAGEYHVSASGNDDADGSVEHPFKTISAVSKVARAGDTITIHAGTYREWVDPPFVGTSNLNRIVYHVANGEKVIIKGSGVVKGWEKVKKGVWKVKLDNTLFGDYNPYGEINVRQAVFYPKRPGINYITVSGFKMSQAATPWAPPTYEQIGLIGPNWSKGWIIENNTISHSKCSGITFGTFRSTGQNYSAVNKKKNGYISQLEAVFSGLKNGWSKENVGSHIVRNNAISA